MPRTIDHNLAVRAVEAWMRRQLSGGPEEHGAKPSGFDKQIEQARQRIRDQLVRALVDARVDDGFCQNLGHGREALARRIEDHARPIDARVHQLERLVGRSPSVWRRHRELIKSLRSLADPGGAAVAGLLHELCLGLSLQTGGRIPWVRR